MIQQVTVDGADIQGFIIDRLAPVCRDQQLSITVLSLLAYATILMKPDIKFDELQKLVQEVAQSIIVRFAGSNGLVAN